MPDTTSTPRSNDQRVRHAQLTGILQLLRGTKGNIGAIESIAAIEARLRSDEVYRKALFDECADLLWNTDFTEVLDEVGILSDQGLLSGVWSRLGGRIASLPGRDDMLLDVIDGVIEKRDRHWLEAVRGNRLTSFLVALLDTDTADVDANDAHEDRRRVAATFRSPKHQLASACIVLASRITGAGSNPRLLKQLPTLDDWDSPFVQLGRRVERFAVWYVDESSDRESNFDFAPLVDALDDCEGVIVSFRTSKAEYGTNLELSSLSLRVAQQIRRLRSLLQIARAPLKTRARSIAEIVEQVLLSRITRFGVASFAREKFDLIAYLTVGHAAKHGDKYVVYERKKYAKFLMKSVGGGILVAIFACLKIYLSKAELAPFSQAFVYGLNYAVCFALIFLFGATLATKQPAMTASRLAGSLEAKTDADDFPSLVQAIFRSQFISFVGNILGAATFALLIASAIQAVTPTIIVSSAKSATLLKSLHPFESLSLFYAAIAGVMLSLSGFISGYVDNAVVFHKVADRIAAGMGIFRFLPHRARIWLSNRVNESFGALIGTVALGFLLGSAGAVGILFGIPFDIRHIAFASSHAALGLLYSAETPTLSLYAVTLVSVLLIGFVNFLVSFSLTLAVAVESRKVKGAAWRAQLLALKHELLSQPLRFLFAQQGSPPTQRDETKA